MRKGRYNKGKYAEDAKLKKLTAYGYVGFWRDGDIGWCMPRCLNSYDKPNKPDGVSSRDFGAGSYGHLCKITITPILKRQKDGPLLKRKFKK